MKNKDLLPHIVAIDTVENLKLGGKLSLMLAKNKKKLLDAYNPLEETRVKLCEQFCTKNERGESKKNPDGTYVISPENDALLTKEYGPLLEEEVEIVMLTFSQTVLEQFSDITPRQMSSLLMFTFD